jgi:hypothetical protein
VDNLVESIKKRWLKWDSLPFVFAILLIFYVTLASELNDLNGVLVSGMNYLLLALPFIAAFVIYFIWCVIHYISEKKKTGDASDSAEEVATSKTSKKTMLIIGSVLTVIAVVVAVLVFSRSSGMKDGKYIIWSEEYHMALSPEVVNKYYLAGDKVQAKGDALTDYTARCVLELDFEKDGTFAIIIDGKKLGAEPGQNGVGYREQCTSDTWVLEEAGDGVYYIKNVENNTYLKWFEAKKNWTTHPNIVDENKDQYSICLTPAK